MQSIYELGGECYNTESLLQMLLDAERCAERVYHDLCDYTFGKDPVTYDYSLAILHEEVGHESWFEELLAWARAGTSGEGSRERGNSPRSSGT